MEKKIAELEKRLELLEKSASKDTIIINFCKKYKFEEHIFVKYDKETIRKYFSAQYVYECFTKGNKYLYGGYYICGIDGHVNIVLSDTEDQLEKEILELGLSE